MILITRPFKEENWAEAEDFCKVAGGLKLLSLSHIRSPPVFTQSKLSNLITRLPECGWHTEPSVSSDGSLYKRTEEVGRWDREKKS